jgi:SAM-dependent methyltransferase
MSDAVVPFEPHRFQGAAAHYLQGRAAYAPALIRRVAEAVGLRPPHRVLDLGCGPGQLAAGFAYFAGAVLAMDPEPEMLAIGRARAEGVLTNITFLQGSSYDLGPQTGRQFGPFRLAAIGRAFHWMDRAETLRRLDALVEPGGAVALFGDTHPDVPENGWIAAFRALRQRHAGEDRAWRRGPGWVANDAVLLDSPFCRLERFGVIERRSTPVAAIVNRTLSMSSSSRDRIGERADQLAAEVATLAQGIAVDGMIREVVESTALVAFRPG